MDEIKKKNVSWVFGLYFGSVGTVLWVILRHGFSVSTPIALSLAIFITLLGGYPILVNFYEPRPFFKRGGKMWTLLKFIVLTAVMSFVIYLVAGYFQ